MELDLSQLLASHAFHSNSSGSIFTFRGNELFKNETAFGSFHLSSDNGKNLMLITRADLGTVEFSIESRETVDYHLVAIDLYSSTRAQPVLTLIGTEIDSHTRHDYVIENYS